MSREFIDQNSERAIIVGLTGLTTLFGLEALHLMLRAYQLYIFFFTALAIWLFLVAMQTFIFDLHIKRIERDEYLSKNIWEALKKRFRYLRNVKHWIYYQNYLILPGYIFWGTVAVMFLNPFNNILQQAWILLSSLGMTIVFWYLKTVFYNHRATTRLQKQHIFLVKIYASFLAYTGSFGLLRYYGYDSELFAIVVFCLTFFLLHQAMFQHHFIGFDTLKFLIFISGLMGIFGFLVYLYWPVNYFTGALVLTAIYNTIWNLIHHKFMEKNLTRLLVYEYFAVLFLILVIVFSITNFGERI